MEHFIINKFSECDTHRKMTRSVMNGSTALVFANNMFIAMKKIAPTLQMDKSKFNG